MSRILQTLVDSDLGVRTRRCGTIILEAAHSPGSYGLGYIESYAEASDLIGGC